jgi:hypothetical protein
MTNMTRFAHNGMNLSRSIGWGSAMFMLAAHYGLLVRTRRGRTVVWSLPVESQADGAV